MSTVRKIILPGGAEHDIGVRESEIDWGTKNLGAGGYSVGDVYFNDFLKPNRFAGLKAAGITVEYSTNGGSTWNAYNITDTAKRAVFTYSGGIYIGGSSTAAVTANNQLRITIDTGAGGVYTILRKFMIYISTNYSQNCTVTIKAALQSAPTNYTLTVCENLPIAGWSGWNVIPCNFITYGNTAASQYGRIQFLFKHSGLSDTTKTGGLMIQRIFGFGGVGWGTPSNMALHGHAYSWDGDLNVTFPAKVTATGGFSGNVSGTASNVSGTVAIANGGTGKTTAKDAANVFIDALEAGTSNPVDGDTYIASYADGKNAAHNGTNTYHRRPISALWNYIKGKIESIVLSNSTSSTSTTTAATSSAVKTAYDLANTANGTANTALSGINGTLIYDHTYTITGGIATFTAHVYCKGVEVTNNYADTDFSWAYRLDDALTGTPQVISLGTGKTKAVSMPTLGYGGHVIGTFTAP